MSVTILIPINYAFIRDIGGSHWFFVFKYKGQIGTLGPGMLYYKDTDLFDGYLNQEIVMKMVKKIRDGILRNNIFLNNRMKMGLDYVYKFQMKFEDKHNLNIFDSYEWVYDVEYNAFIHKASGYVINIVQLVIS